MKKLFSASAIALLLATSSAQADDVKIIYAIGEAVKGTGLATGYSVSGWNKYLDINVGSMLPGDARTIASAVCGAARQKGLQQSWTVRVFLVVGDRPAATCSAK